ncbi:MAG TPA: acetoacetate--CoA ligase [Actinomycetota bacterium]|nr:acetoacetate--CoA ligase [Actinomycetota bacterium]
MTARDPVAEGDLLWSPSSATIEDANVTRFTAWLERDRGVRFEDHAALWRWSVDDLEGFWGAVWEYFGVRSHAPHTSVLAGREMPGAGWFPGARINYAEHALADADDRLAVQVRREDGEALDLTRAELVGLVARAATGLRRLGVGMGDRVVAYLPNGLEALVAVLATASLGAVWSSCSPDFGASAVIDRFRQIEPKVLIAAAGYRYGGVDHDRRDVAQAVAAGLPTLERVIAVPAPNGGRATPGTASWDDVLAEAEPLTFAPVPFEHPLWILYSSGTTGLPKPIVHGHGGMLLEHLKSLSLHLDLREGDRFFWFTTTGWMMWNFLISGLLLGTSVILFDGSPRHPSLAALWRLAESTGMTYFGTSAPYVHACLKRHLRPGEIADLSALRAVGSTGAPLSPEGFAWLYREVKPDLWVGSISGGTDVCTAFVTSSPVLPVHAGELQTRGYGAKVEAFDEDGRSVIDEVGELVLTAPMPCMPVSFWNDPGGERYRSSYFDTYPGVWRHGDWIRVTSRGSCVITGRSDATLNRGGVRIGTAELYRIVDGLPGIAESLVVDTGAIGRDGELLLFVSLEPGATLDDDLRRRIAADLRTALSPRHVPDRVIQVPAIPKTLNGKRLEIPVKRLLLGEAAGEVASAGALEDPAAFEAFVRLADELRR